jgi:hypothetical protein
MYRFDADYLRELFSLHHEKKGVKWDINCNFSEKTTMTIAAETVFREDVIEKV